MMHLVLELVKFLDNQPTTLKYLNITWLAMCFCTDIHGFQKINHNDVDDPLTLSP